MCGAGPCYEQSKSNKGICRRIFNGNSIPVFDELFTIQLQFPIHFVIVGVWMLSFISAVTTYGSQRQSKGKLCLISCCDGKRDFCRNLFGSLFSTITFLAIIFMLNLYSFNTESFCLMNPQENICNPYREKLSCAQYKFNPTTSQGHFFDGYAGFFKIRKTGTVPLSSKTAVQSI